MPLEPPDLPTYDTFDELFEAAQNWARSQGYGIVKRRPGTYRQGIPRRWDLVCTSGEPVHPLSRGRGMRRRTASTKIGCPWRAKAIQRSGSPWALEVQEPSHTHEASPYPALDLAHRRRAWTAVQRDAVRSKIATGLPTREIVALMRQEFPGQPWVSKDVQNERDLVRRELLDIYTPTQFLLYHLDSANDGTFYKADVGPDHKLRAVFWSPPWCKQQWQRFPHILSLDNTYKTNRFGMPLLNVTGITNIGTTFNIGFALVSREDEDAYRFAVSALDTARSLAGIPTPYTIITDFEIALKNALSTVFPEISQQICLWHVSKNVIHEVKKR